jgi:hypothetical protein
MRKAQREIARKLSVLQHAEETGHVAKTCRYFGVGRQIRTDDATQWRNDTA